MGFHKRGTLDRHPIGEGRTRMQAYTDRLMMVVIDFTDGPTERPDPPHSHAHEQISYVESGRLRYFLGEKHEDLEPGDMVTIPGGVPHSIQLLSPEVRLVDAFHPVREDFLAP